jgi:hypothetical protein
MTTETHVREALIGQVNDAINYGASHPIDALSQVF